MKCNARCSQKQGGYRHWRCQRRAPHWGNHRYNNYVWPRFKQGHTEYRPVGVDAALAEQGEKP